MTTRGERNNNPMNLRISIAPWKGKITPNTDGSFEQFDTAINGIRAGAKILENYYRLHGLSTVAQIINRWAPPIENITDYYISDVCRIMAVGVDDHLDLLDATVLGNLVASIIYHENGEQPYSSKEIEVAISQVIPKSA